MDCSSNLLPIDSIFYFQHAELFDVYLYATLGSFWFYWWLLCCKSYLDAQQIKGCKFENFVEWNKKTKLVERSAIYSIFWLLSNLQRKEILPCLNTLINSLLFESIEKNMRKEDISCQKAYENKWWDSRSIEKPAPIITLSFCSILKQSGIFVGGKLHSASKR